MTQIEKSHIVIPGSRLNRFSTGNNETLRIPNIHDELRKFYSKHYSSNLMNLVLVSRLSLDELEEVATGFTAVENKELPEKDFSGEVCFDKEHSFGKIFKIVPDKPLKQLTMKWILPGQMTNDHHKSCQYLSHVIGHEGPNSLLSQLIKDGLAQRLSSGANARMMKAIRQFSVSVILTSKGEAQYEEVIRRVYQYIN